MANGVTGNWYKVYMARGTWHVSCPPIPIPLYLYLYLYTTRYTIIEATATAAGSRQQLLGKVFLLILNHMILSLVYWYWYWGLGWGAWERGSG